MCLDAGGYDPVHREATDQDLFNRPPSNHASLNSPVSLLLDFSFLACSSSCCNISLPGAQLCLHHCPTPLKRHQQPHFQPIQVLTSPLAFMGLRSLDPVSFHGMGQPKQWLRMFHNQVFPSTKPPPTVEVISVSRWLPGSVLQGLGSWCFFSPHSASLDAGISECHILLYILKLLFCRLSWFRHI